MTARVVLNGDGLRIAALDSDGALQHELIWERGGAVPRLVRARLRLDWGQWITLEPGGLAWVDRFFIGSLPGWQSMDYARLVGAAAAVLGVPEADVRFYYGPDDLRLDASGWVHVKHRRDVLFAARGKCQSRRFIACMAPVRWGCIDALPVMHLYQSLLPGIGHAVFTLLRGLYDDQQGNAGPPLRYRGLPVYPSLRAFRLFSHFFKPTHAAGEDPLAVFLNPARSSEVLWQSAGPAPARREPSPAVEPAWRSLFPEGPPRVPEMARCWAVPLYRTDPRQLAEPATQHLAVETARRLLAERVHRPERVLVHGWDCGAGDLAQSGAAGTVLFRNAAFAIQEACRLIGPDGERPSTVTFRPARRCPTYPTEHDVLCVWLPFARYRSASACRAWVARIVGALRQGDHALVCGPRLLHETFSNFALEVEATQELMTSPGADILRTLLPRLTVHREATLFLVRR